MVGFFEKRRQERAEREAMKELEKKARDEAWEQRKERLHQRIEYLKTIVFTPQSLEDYTRQTRTPLEVIVMPGSNKGVVFQVTNNYCDDEFGRWMVYETFIKVMHYEDFLVQSEIFAIVDARSEGDEHYYGIPVRRKR
jgi:hypothetical protein